MRPVSTLATDSIVAIIATSTVNKNSDIRYRKFLHKKGAARTRPQAPDAPDFGFTSGAAPTQSTNPRQAPRVLFGDARPRDKPARV
jgi:hypothetical protein